MQHRCSGDNTRWKVAREAAEACARGGVSTLSEYLSSAILLLLCLSALCENDRSGWLPCEVAQSLGAPALHRYQVRQTLGTGSELAEHPRGALASACCVYQR